MIRAEPATPEYSPRDEDVFRGEVEREFARCLREDEDVEITRDQRLIMTNIADHQRYRVQLTTVGGVLQFTFTPV